MDYYKKRYSQKYDHIKEEKKLYLIRERFSLIFLSLLILGLLILFYPLISNEWNKMTNTTAINDYKTTVESYSKEYTDKLFKEANDYNANLLQFTNPLNEYKKIKNYNDVLNIENGMMCFVRIPKLDIKLPVYHGFDKEILNYSCGHLEGTSLPVGGESTHAVISAHRGLPTAKLFTDLDELSKGDYFSIEVLGKILYYKVDQIKIVDPDDTRDLRIIRGKDYVTLLTCTPYRLNTQRLLVRGERTSNPFGFTIENEAFRLNPYYVCLCLVLLILILCWVYVLNKYKNIKKVSDKDLDEMERQMIVRIVGEKDEHKKL